MHEGSLGKGEKGEREGKGKGVAVDAGTGSRVARESGAD